jgi:hypothetical protein
MAEALTILGYKGVYHGIKATRSPEDWKFFNRAADASFPTLPTYAGPALTQDQWEELYGPYEATTDVASVFGRNLTTAYPDAKVVLVIRDFEPWYTSINRGVFNQLWSGAANFSIQYLEPLLGSEAGVASRKMILGFFRAQTVDEARLNAREAYDRHHRELREAVPTDQLLEYRMGQGWEPLCEFLGKPVPDVEFPWVNEAAELEKVVREKIMEDLVSAAWVVMPWLAGVAAAGAGIWVGIQQWTRASRLS